MNDFYFKIDERFNEQTGLFGPPEPKRPSLGNQHHEAVDKILDRPRLETQFGKIINAMSDGLWHTQYEIARHLGVPQGSVGSQIRNARVDGYIINKRRRAQAVTWEYRMEGKKSV